MIGAATPPIVTDVADPAEGSDLTDNLCQSDREYIAAMN